MKLQSTTKLKGKHSEYLFSHRVKGVKVAIEVVALNTERALAKAWSSVKQLYKDLKIKGVECGELPFPDGIELWSDDRVELSKTV
jgi:hypothetical protein